jgi:hypothetical protein
MLIILSKVLVDYAVEMPLCGMIHISSFINIGAGVQAI